MQNTPFDERYLQRRLAALEKRLAALETAPRAGNTSISGGKLTVGAPGSPDRIEIDATAHSIRVNSAAGPAGVLRGLSGTGGGASLDGAAAAGDVLPFATSARLAVSGVGTDMQATSTDDAGSTVSTGEVSIAMTYSGTANAPQVNISSRSTSQPDDAIVYMNSDGGVVLYNYDRTTDPPSPGAGAVTLYVKASRLYYRDGTGTVRGPL